MTQAHMAEQAEPAEQFDERVLRYEGFLTKAEVVLPTKILTKRDLEYLAMNIEDTLLESNNALEAYVMIKQMEELVKQLKERLHDKALLKCEGKSGSVLGAKYETRTSKTYEYDAPTLATMDNEVTTIKAKMKLIKNMIEGGQVFIDEKTGVENWATLVTIGQTLSITLPKE